MSTHMVVNCYEPLNIHGCREEPSDLGTGDPANTGTGAVHGSLLAMNIVKPWLVEPSVPKNKDV